MNTWFLFAIGAPFLWAVVNHLDKFLLEKYFKKGGVATLLIFSSVIGIFLLPILYFLHPAVFEMNLRGGLILFVAGIISVFGLWAYFISLHDEEASVVVLFYQLIPVFGFAMGYLFLGETLTRMQGVAMALIVLGTMIVSFEIDEDNNFKLKKKTVLLMLSSAFLCALNSVLFKYAAIEENFWTSLFWENVGLGIFGLTLLIFFKRYRGDFINMVKDNSKGIFTLNIINEIIYTTGNFLAAYAFLLAPVALVLLVNSYQPVLVFILGIILTIFFPKISKESLHIKHIAQKIIALIIVCIGTYLLFI